MGRPPELHNMVELALKAWVCIRQPHSMKVGGLLTLPPVYGCLGWPSQSSAKELTLEVWIKESGRLSSSAVP